MFLKKNGYNRIKIKDMTIYHKEGVGLPIVYITGANYGVLYVRYLLSQLDSQRPIYYVSVKDIGVVIRIPSVVKRNMFSNIASRLETFLETIGQADFIGQSFGSVVLTYIYNLKPNLFRKLVIISPVCMPDSYCYCMNYAANYMNFPKNTLEKLSCICVFRSFSHQVFFRYQYKMFAGINYDMIPKEKMLLIQGKKDWLQNLPKNYQILNPDSWGHTGNSYGSPNDKYFQEINEFLHL